MRRISSFSESILSARVEHRVQPRLPPKAESHDPLRMSIKIFVRIDERDSDVLCVMFQSFRLTPASVPSVGALCNPEIQLTHSGWENVRSRLRCISFPATFIDRRDVGLDTCFAVEWSN